MSANPDFDVVIIGAGLGGSALAYSLRESGLRVLILERGDYLKQEAANWDPEQVVTAGRYENPECWLDGEGRSFTPRVYYNVGGNSKFFGAVALRFRPEDFRRRTYREGETVAWPISYDDLAPYYDEAELQMWVHGLAGADPKEADRGEFPFPPLEHEPAIAWLAERLARTGLKPFPIPIAVDQGPGGRCQKGSPCDGFPCKIRAKGDGENSFLRPALRAFPKGDLELRTGSRVTRLVHDERGEEVVAAEYVRENRVETVAARVFVLAAGAANSAALLLRSKSEHHPDGLGNSSGQVGRNFMAHNNTVLMAFSPFRRNPTNFQKTLAFNDFYLDSEAAPATSGRSNAPGKCAAPRGHIQMRGKVVPANLRKSPRFLLRLFARYISRRSFDFWIMTEDLADPDNRVELVPEREGLDRRVTPIRLSRTLNNSGPHRALVRNFKRSLRRAGLPLIIEREPSPRTIQHQCGTLRFGSDPSTCVFDADCQSHEIDNLYAADGSVFPSSAAVNPALTIAANALRIGSIIAGRMSEAGNRGDIPSGAR